jgi:TPR repeat protein
MEKAAADGYPKAKLALAEYEMGKYSSMTPVKPNLRRALEYCRSCADEGNTDAMVYLSVLYSSGVGEPRGQNDSPHHLLHTAAQRGNTKAMDHLIQRYGIGHGEAVDPLEAARLYFLTHGSGMHVIGIPDLLDSEGNAVAQDNLLWDDVARVLSLFVKAGEKRQPAAAFALANQHREAGKLAESAILYRFARDLGHKEAGIELQRVEAELTPEQKARAGDPKIFPFAKPVR